MRKLLLALALTVVLGLIAAAINSQGVDKAMLLKPPPDSWPMYNGDYTGRRFSSLKVINDANVQNLSLDYMAQIVGTGGRGGTIRVAGTPLLVNGVFYFTATDNAWAVDARTGRTLWHFYRQSTGEEPATSNRGFAILGHWLYYMSRDNFLISLDAETGKMRWAQPVADPKQFYFSTVPPMIVGDHVLVGTGGDSLDLSGFLQSRDPETGEIQWTTYSTPRKGEDGINTWPDDYASTHGGGGPWIPGTYDPELNLYFYGTGNANPVYASQSRTGDDLFTCTIVAINPDTGKRVWYFQASPHDTHDWDAVQTPVLIDGTIDGKPRKLLAQASRNGYFFVLDRTTGKSVVTVPFIDTLNWSKGVRPNGSPDPNPEKYPSLGGVIVSPSSGGATNWPPPSFSPQTGLFYVGSGEGYSIFYVSDTDDHPEGYGGKEAGAGSGGPGTLRAIDYKTGKQIWKHEWPGGGGAAGMLTTAGNLLFTANGTNLIAFNAANGKILWHAGLLSGANAPITYMLDGKQHVTVVAGDVLYSFVLNEPSK